MTQDEKVCIASLEMKPYRTMVRMVKQGMGGNEPTPRDIEAFMKWTDGRLWLYDRLGEVKPAVMLAVIRYAVATFGITHFMIDNLTKVIPGEDSYNAQKDFVNALFAIAQDLNIHIHLVMHVKKAEDESKPPNKMSIKGAGSITDIVDNIFIVWRNKPKEKQIREGENAKFGEPDALLNLEKQRNAEGEHSEASYMFWFEPFSLQYLDDRHMQAKPLVDVHKPHLKALP
jgi:twinkle protein